MDYDPLSQPTRRGRRLILAIASVTILAKLFCARIEQLPIGGVALNFDSGFLDWALIGALIYLSGILIYYLKIDWTNRGRTPAQVAESEARQAVLIEVERDVTGEATTQAITHDSRKHYPSVVDDLVRVFWRFKSNPDVAEMELHAAMGQTGMDKRAFAKVEAVMRASWQTVADRTTAEAERAKASKQDEIRRFWWLEAGIPAAAVLLAFLVSAAPDRMRNLLGLDPCANDQIETVLEQAINNN